ncbi:HNH endonuclease [Eubacterium oxidoreducens]|uniref:HNH endonuclease n=1 Tax=Eubacterium oxidoreducens TaxID=1732 RepID=A0A1G6AY85_EUBOX|nr:HNH endonuclease [Eubacterium oxidoreducens]SDB13345.1 HNH endonuclease [Eubacterium oxidoreducens]
MSRKNWVFICNTSQYDIIAAFSNLNELYWKQSVNVSVGDTVYIYVGKPYSAIMYKCKVLEVDSEKDLIDDSPYVVNGYNFEDYGRYMRIKLEKSFDEDEFPLESLKENGLKTVQGPSIISDSLLNYLENKTNSGVDDIRVLFCNIAYMQFYAGTTDGDVPVNGGEYVKIHHDALEKYNYHEESDGFVYGFVETKYQDGFESGKYPKQIHIENIDKAYAGQDSIDNVTVIFCAKSDLYRKTVIVGWYKNATVYRNRMFFDDRQYNLKAKYSECVLLDEMDRNYVINRAKSSEDKVGMGQSNVWYANKKAEEIKVKQDVLRYIDNYKNAENKRNFIKPIPEDKEEQVKHALGLDDESLKEYAEATVSKEPVAVSVSTKRFERSAYIAEYAKRRANGICQLCKEPAPFKKPDGTPFLETHHIIELANGGSDSIDNTVALCPNCHRKMHYGKKSVDDIRKLQESNIKSNSSVGVGAKVKHTRYGQGKIIEIRDDDATIVFGNQKKLIRLSSALTNGIISLL